MTDMLPWKYNLKLIEEINPAMRYKEGEDFTAWQTNARAKIAELLGLDHMQKAENDLFTIESQTQTEEYTEYRFTLQSEPGYIVPGVMRVPSGLGGKLPVMLTLQGHSTGMHVSLGIVKFPQDVELVEREDGDYLVRAVKEGCVGVAIEQRNFGVCGSNPQTGNPDCHVSTMNAILNGRTTIGERVMDAMCTIDAVLAHFDFVDPDRIMLMGHSGGGTATIYTAALDERICLAVPSCSLCTYKHSIAAMLHCVCNFVPNIAKYFDMGDIGGLVAPRKLVVVNGKEDDIFPDEGVRESYEITKQLYAAAGVPDACALVTGDGGHRFYADPAWRVVRSMMLDNEK